MSRCREVFRKTGDIFELMVDECDTYAAVVEKASHALSLQRGAILKPFLLRLISHTAIYVEVHYYT